MNLKGKHLPDEILIDQIKNGNKLAFNLIYGRYWDRLFQASYKVLLDRDLSQDVVQEVFVDFWIRRNEHSIRNLSNYFYQAVRFQSLKNLRKRKLLDLHESYFQNILHPNTTEEQVNLDELKKSVERSLKALPEKSRSVFEMSRFQHMSNKEIAEKLGLSQRTVEWHLYSALKHLKTCLSTEHILFILVYLAL